MTEPGSAWGPFGGESRHGISGTSGIQIYASPWAPMVPSASSPCVTDNVALVLLIGLPERMGTSQKRQRNGARKLLPHREGLPLLQSQLLRNRAGLGRCCHLT